MGDSAPPPNPEKQPTEPLEALRAGIDQIDRKLVDLLNERGKLVLDIGELKRQSNSRIYAPSRETAVFQRVVEHNQGPLPPRALQSIFREIMSACIALEQPITVAYLGPQGTFTHLAARAKFGASVDYLPTRDIMGIFRSVATGAAELGVVPVENSIDGGISDTLDAFMNANVQICSELVMEIHHCLMARERQTSIKTIYSKPQVFAQCARWLSEHYGDCDLVSVASTARACELAGEEADTAAIAHASAAATYGLEIIHKNIEDIAHNVTRFVVLGQESCTPSGRDKTSIVLSVTHKSGALHDALRPFQTHGLNLTRIESRPSKRNPWEYYFFIDFEGHRDDEEARAALQEVHERCIYLQVLGSYPLAETSVSID
jgi:chorismate mutase/prephenate dehydratase